jgi:MFS family permease
MFTVGRAVAGLGASGLIGGSLMIWTATVPPEKLPALQGILVGIGQLGVACAPLLGGALTSYASWRWCKFSRPPQDRLVRLGLLQGNLIKYREIWLTASTGFYINLPVGAVVATFLVLLHIPELTEKGGIRALRSQGLFNVLDLIGFVLFAPAAIMFLMALEFGGNRYPWDSATVVGLLCGSVALFAVFCWWERRKGRDAMIPTALLRVRLQWCASLLMFGFLGTMFIFSYFLPIYLQAVKGDSPFMSGVHNLPAILCQVTMVLVNGVAGKYSDFM